MEKILVDNYTFYKKNMGNANFIFSTADNKLNFNINSIDGKENLKKLELWFGLKEVGYLNQIHSNLVYNYDGEHHQGDGLITIKKNCAVGIFTADCVPVLLYDDSKKVIAAIHSGWKGTISGIILNAIDKMAQEYGCKAENIYACIGPHIKSCCYEVGLEVADRFRNNIIFEDENTIINNHLNLEKCIIKQLTFKGVHKENIEVLDICTFCNEDVKMHSFRKNKELSGRMFSFIYLEH